MGEIRYGTVKSPRFEMDWFSFGQGKRAFVMIPGVSVKSVMLSAEAVAEGYASFAEEYTVFLFDRKKNIQAGYSVSDMAEDTAEAMRTVGIAEADLFGASQGGMIVQMIAARYPELVRRMVLSSTYCRPSELSVNTFERWIALAQKSDAVALNRDVTEKVYCEQTRRAYASFFSSTEGDATQKEMTRFARVVAACLSFDSSAELSRVRAPALVIGSEGDRTLSCEGTTDLAARLGCDSYLYREFGHAVYDEAPDFKERMLNFFRG